MSNLWNANHTRLLRAILAGWNDVEGWDYWGEGMSETIPMIGQVEVVNYEFGSSDYDDGKPYVIIFKVTIHDEYKFDDEVHYFRKSGYTESYSGEINWSGEFREVVPKEKVVYEYV